MANPNIDDSDVQRLLYVARVLRELGNMGRNAQIGDMWPEVIMSIGTIRKVLEMTEEEFVAEGIVRKEPD